MSVCTRPVQVKCKFKNRPFKRTGWGTNYRTGGGRTPPNHEFETNPIRLLNQTKNSVMDQKKQLFSHPFTSIQEHYRSTTRLGENWSKRDSKVVKNLLIPVSVYFLKKAGGENRGDLPIGQTDALKGYQLSPFFKVERIIVC